MKSSLILSLFVLSTNATNFFIIGDYGWVQDLTDSYYTFGKMSEIMMEAHESPNPDPRDLIDYFLTVGDNLYPRIGDSPTDEEFDEMMSLFTYPYLDELPIYAVRGNHDAVFDWKAEIELQNRYEKWNMPALYFKKEFDIGDGKKMGILFIDSSLVICSDYSYSDDSSTSHIPNVR